MLAETRNPAALAGFRGVWSGKRDSNSRPQPWQGCALPAELLSLLAFANIILFVFFSNIFCL